MTTFYFPVRWFKIDNKWHSVEVQVTGNRARIWIDGVEIDSEEIDIEGVGYMWTVLGAFACVTALPNDQSRALIGASFVVFGVLVWVNFDIFSRDI